MDLHQTSQETEIGRLTPPRASSAIKALITAKNTDHPLLKDYLEKKEIYDKNLLEKINSTPNKPEIILPDLKPICIHSLYEVFKNAFKFFNNKDFDEEANYGEGRHLAKTLIFYFLQHKTFYRSPIIHKNLNEPDLKKGLLIIGGFGCGKTSILKTFQQMFLYAASNPLGVKDIEGTEQFLGRYKLGFGFYTTNDVVADYEGLASHEEKEKFWKLHSHGFKYYDDLMTERTANNYGKVEIFKDILEKRCFSDAKTMISMNYSGESVETTLDAISDKYGERVFDRVFEMFTIINLNGKSLRK